MASSTPVGNVCRRGAETNDGDDGHPSDSAQDVQKVIDMGLQAGLASTLERLDELLLTLQA